MALEKKKKVLDIELWEVFKAKDIALRETASRKAHEKTVFPDFQTAIRKIQADKTIAGQALRAQIENKTKELKKSRREMTIRWVSNHRKIEQNEPVNRVAKKAAIERKTGNAQWSSLGYINENITEAKKSAVWFWHQVKNKHRKSRSRSYYIAHLKYMHKEIRRLILLA